MGFEFKGFGLFVFFLGGRGEFLFYFEIVAVFFKLFLGVGFYVGFFWMGLFSCDFAVDLDGF